MSTGGGGGGAMLFPLGAGMPFMSSDKTKQILIHMGTK